MTAESPRTERMLGLLDAIEHELDRLTATTPPLETPFREGITFENWLRTTFLPNARNAVRTGQLPATSQVGLMAVRQYEHHSSIPEAADLARLLSEFDHAVRAAGSGGKTST